MILNSLNILFVDDVSFYKSLLLSHLDALKINYTLDYQNNVKNALNKLDESQKTETPINLIISDFHMPDFTGLDFTKKVRENKDYSKIPIIIMTSTSEKNNILNCLSEGADSYVIKPWEIEHLVEGLNAALKKHDIQITKSE